MLNLALDDINVGNINAWAQEAIRPFDILLDGIDFKILGVYAAKLQKNIHLILTSLDKDGRSDFSVITIYQSGRSRYFYSRGKNNVEKKRYLEMLFSNEMDVFIGLSPEDDFLEHLSYEVGYVTGNTALGEKIKNVAYVKNLGMIRESTAIKSLEDSLFSMQEKWSGNIFPAAKMETLPIIVGQICMLGFELEKFLFGVGPHLFFHKVFYNTAQENEKMKKWSSEKILKEEEEALKKYEWFMNI